ncbi:hypothetical protein PoB_004157900 [Plakobranchus ocellatus]|uniref:Uncharacterized protein n=1 Tax=Plakobranchus ocellatus TaxID=259542 RepID=A0AAV4B9N5_9GAST|nr:hypothetical protein PoB_004157900 [Plakobranchus ocellatus]
MPGKLSLVYRWIGVRSKPSRNLLLSTSCSSQLNLTVTSINSASRTCGSEIAPSGVRTASLDTSASVSKPFCRILSRSYFKGSVPTWPPERIENHRGAYVGDSQRANVCTAASGHYGSLKLVSNFVNVSHAIEWILDYRVLSGIHRSSIFFVPSPVCRSYSTVASGFAAVHMFRKQIGQSFRGETTGFLSFNHMGQKASNLSRKDRQFQGSASQSGKMDTVEVVVCTTEEVQDGQGMQLKNARGCHAPFILCLLYARSMVNRKMGTSGAR